MIERRPPHGDAGTHLPYCQSSALRKFCFCIASNALAAQQRLAVASVQVSIHKFQFSDTRRNTAGVNGYPSLLRSPFRLEGYFK